MKISFKKYVNNNNIILLLLLLILFSFIVYISYKLKSNSISYLFNKCLGPNIQD